MAEENILISLDNLKAFWDKARVNNIFIGTEDEIQAAITNGTIVNGMKVICVETSNPIYSTTEMSENQFQNLWDEIFEGGSV